MSSNPGDEEERQRYGSPHAPKGTAVSCETLRGELACPCPTERLGQARKDDEVSMKLNTRQATHTKDEAVLDLPDWRRRRSENALRDERSFLWRLARHNFARQQIACILMRPVRDRANPSCSFGWMSRAPASSPRP